MTSSEKEQQNIIIAAASFSKQKYFLEETFQKLPGAIKEEIQILLVLTAQKLKCTVILQLDQSLDIAISLVDDSGSMDFDQIGADLEIKKMQREQKELLHSLELWYKLKDVVE